MKKIIIFTGAGISAPSGVPTFRGNGGLWGEYKVEEVATIEAWRKNRTRLLNFYNARRKELNNFSFNEAHQAITDLQQKYKGEAEIIVITQNVDGFHTKAGNENIIELHGNLLEIKADKHPSNVRPYDFDLTEANYRIGGLVFRPNIVLFGDPVPNYSKALLEVSQSDHIIVVGSSLQVQPASTLVDMFLGAIPITVIDPEEVIPGVNHIKASTGKTIAEAIIKTVENEIQ